VGILRNKLASLNLETHDRALCIKTMLHSSDRQKDFKYEYTYDWTGKNYFCFVSSQFYAIADLEKNGFIHADGSLRFVFKIKKNNI
jgi:hypothetical protein